MLETRPFIRTPRDVARMVGLQAGAEFRDVASAFARATGYDTWLRAVEEPVLTSARERWEVRVLPARPRLRLMLRKDCRGAWTRCAADVPEDVLAFLEAAADRDGRIVTARGWRDWERMDWTHGAAARRLRDFARAFRAVSEVPRVRRRTGETAACLMIDPIGMPEEGEPVRIPLPCPARAVSDAVQGLRAGMTPAAA